MSELKFRGETEQQLIEALKQGRQEVFGPLYDAYAPVMMGIILRIVKDPVLAEEVLQETFVTVWSRIGDYDPSNSRFLTWILSLVREQALDAYFKARSKSMNNNGQDGNVTITGEQEQSSFPDDKLLSCLSSLERQILELIYLKGKSRSEASAELGLTEEELKANLIKAFIHLKKVRQA